MLTLAFSPCPNDTFIFDALVNKKIDTEGLEFNVALEDVQTLNQFALEEKFDFSKISFGVLPLITHNYKVLETGSALGKGVGPLLISSIELNSSDLNIHDFTIAIPGENTTAHLLFSLAYPLANNKIFIPFHEIENYILCNENALGVIIHENRFTYQQKGLYKILDLGNFWEQNINLPIPLGGIVAHKRVDIALQKKVDNLINKSLQFAFNNYPFISDYVKKYAQEMSELVMKQHIDLYVNNFSLNLGEEGRAAVDKLIEVYQNINTTANINTSKIYINE